MGTREDLAAAVLVGGKSQRMGRDKVMLPLAGQSMLGRTLDLLATVTDQIHVVGRPQSSESTRSSVPWLQDVQPGRGPAGGVLTALEATDRPRCLVVACDMPFLTTHFLEGLVDLDPRALAVVPRDLTGWHPLCAVYSRELIPVLRERLRLEVHRLQGLFDEIPCRAVDRAEVAALAGPGPDPLTNVNRPDEFEQARRVLER